MRRGDLYRVRHPSGDPKKSRVFAVVKRHVSAGEVARTMERAGVDVLADVWLFDVYRGDRLSAGRRGLTFRLRLQAADRTLTDDELAHARQRLIDAVQAAHPATLRG